MKITVGAAFLTHNLSLREDSETVTKLKFEIWDTAGQERYRYHTNTFLWYQLDVDNSSFRSCFRKKTKTCNTDYITFILLSNLSISSVLLIRRYPCLLYAHSPLSLPTVFWLNKLIKPCEIRSFIHDIFPPAISPVPSFYALYSPYPSSLGSHPTPCSHLLLTHSWCQRNNHQSIVVNYVARSLMYCYKYGVFGLH